MDLSPRDFLEGDSCSPHNEGTLGCRGQAARRSIIPLDRILDGLDVQVDPLVVHDVRRERSLNCSQANAPTVHCTQSGSVVLELAGGATVCFSKDNVSVLPARRPAAIVPNGGAQQKLPTRGYSHPSPVPARKTEAGSHDPDILTASGGIRATYRESVGLFDHLREPLVENLAPDDPICRSFEELLDEIAAQQAGSRAMVETLLRRCLILLLRRCRQHTECHLSWLVALDDARLGRAVAAMHDRPEYSFTLPTLAELAGMSRSVFAARFADSLGQSPIGFLKTLRLARAAQLLTRTDLPVKTVAARVGYSSRSSFTRAFLARHGVGPTAFRAAARGLAPSPPTARSHTPATEAA